MPITEEHIKEEICRAHIAAVGAMAGLNRGHDCLDYGVDGRFSEVERVPEGYVSSGLTIEYQAKSTVRWHIEEDHIVYDLEVRSYNAIARRGQHRVTLFLILLCLPRDQAAWHSISDDGTLLREQCYWHVFAGPESNNTSTVRIRIPVAQRFTPQALQDLLYAERSRQEVA